MRHEFIEHFGEPGEIYDECTWYKMFEVWKTAYQRGKVDRQMGVCILTDEEKYALLVGANCVAYSSPDQARLIRRLIADDKPLSHQHKISREIAGRLAFILLTKGLPKDQMIRDVAAIIESLSGRDLETWALEHSIKEKIAMVA